jgi:hypothetical protein
MIPPRNSSSDSASPIGLWSAFDRKSPYSTPPEGMLISGRRNSGGRKASLASSVSPKPMQAYRPTRLTSSTTIRAELVLRIPRFGISKPDFCCQKRQMHDQKTHVRDHVVGKLRLRFLSASESAALSGNSIGAWCMVHESGGVACCY